MQLIVGKNKALLIGIHFLVYLRSNNILNYHTVRVYKHTRMYSTITAWSHKQTPFNPARKYSFIVRMVCMSHCDQPSSQSRFRTVRRPHHANIIIMLNIVCLRSLQSVTDTVIDLQCTFSMYFNWLKLRQKYFLQCVSFAQMNLSTWLHSHICLMGKGKRMNHIIPMIFLISTDDCYLFQWNTQRQSIQAVFSSLGIFNSFPNISLFDTFTNMNDWPALWTHARTNVSECVK